jgi:hypothetical protein
LARQEESRRSCSFRVWRPVSLNGPGFKNGWRDVGGDYATAAWSIDSKNGSLARLDNAARGVSDRVSIGAHGAGDRRRGCIMNR